jgi:hypothetical protein
MIMMGYISENRKAIAIQSKTRACACYLSIHLHVILQLFIHECLMFYIGNTAIFRNDKKVSKYINYYNLKFVFCEFGQHGLQCFAFLEILRCIFGC